MYVCVWSVCLSVCLYVCMYVCMCTYIYIYIYTYIFIYIELTYEVPDPLQLAAHQLREQELRIAVDTDLNKSKSVWEAPYVFLPPAATSLARSATRAKPYSANFGAWAPTNQGESKQLGCQMYLRTFVLCRARTVRHSETHGFMFLRWRGLSVQSL